MATPETNEKCYYLQHDPHQCKIKLEKFHFDILCRFGVIKESLLGGGGGGGGPPGEIGLMETRFKGQKHVYSDTTKEKKAWIANVFF